MRSICFYFQVHQPFRLRTYRFFDIGDSHDYFDNYRNKYILRRVADKCYLPMNQLLYDMIKEYGSAFKVSFSISGTVLDQFQMFTPDVIESYQRLAQTGCVEFLAETYSHSLSSLKSKSEFFHQVNEQRQKIKQLFGQEPVAGICIFNYLHHAYCVHTCFQSCFSYFAYACIRLDFTFGIRGYLPYYI